MTKPASGKLKKDLYERKNRIHTLKDELLTMKKTYKNLNLKIKRINEVIIELPGMQDKVKKLEVQYKKKQTELKKLDKLEAEQKARDKQDIVNKKRGRK